MKMPYMLPAYRCGACGHELQHIYVEGGRPDAALLKCYTPNCENRSIVIGVALVEADATVEAKGAA